MAKSNAKNSHAKKKKSGTRHTGLIVALALMSVLAIVLIGGGSYAMRLLGKLNIDDPLSSWNSIPMSNVDSEDVPSQGETTYRPADIPDDVNSLETIPVMYNTDYVTNILLLGVDRDDDVRYVGRSDTCIVVSINRATKEITLVSLMRDNYVKIPGYASNKFNAAFFFGGPELLKQTVELNFRLHIDDYFAVNFDAFSHIINALGGLTVEMSAAEAEGVGVGNTADTYDLDGAKALQYARIRNGVGDDFGRTSRQRHVIRLVTEKAKHMTISQMTSILENCLPEINTNMSEDKLMNYIFSSGEYLQYTFKDYQMPPSNGYDDPYIDGVGRCLKMTDAKGSVLDMLHALYGTVE